MSARPTLKFAQDGIPAITIIVPADGSLDRAAQHITQAVKERHGVELEIMVAGRPLADLPTPHAIALGCLANNPFIEALYFRWNTLVDRWHPGTGGWLIQTITSPHKHGEHVLLLGGSDTSSVHTATNSFLKQLEASSNGEIPWMFEVQLGSDHLPLPQDRIDILGTSPSQVSTPECALPDKPYESGFRDGSPRNHLLRLGMYGPQADNFHLSRSSEFGLRYLYTGKPEDGERYRQTLLSEVRAGVVQKLYHYKSLRMFQLSSLFGSSPIFSHEESEEITAGIRRYLMEESGVANIDEIREGFTGLAIFNRHIACDALNLWAGADWLWRLTGDGAWLDQRTLADTYFEAQANVDVPLTGLTEGYASYLEVFLEWLLLSRPEQIADNPHIRLWVERVMGLCTNTGNLVIGPQTDEIRYPYNLLRKLGYLLNDGRCLFVADLREHQINKGMDRVLQFSAGQAYAGDTPARQPDSNSLTIYPINERLRQWMAPSVTKGKGFDRAMARSGWEEDDDYLMVIGVRGGAKALPNAGALAAYERFGQRLITSDAVPLYPSCASPWRHSTICINVGGLGTGMFEGAEQLATGKIAGGHFFSFQVTTPNLCRWIRTLYWKPSAYLLVVDRVLAGPDEDFSVSVNWRCGGRIDTLTDDLATLKHEANTQFHVQTSEGVSLTSETNTHPVLGAAFPTEPTTETMLHGTIEQRGGNGEIAVATLLHADQGHINPQYQLSEDSENWIITGTHETLGISKESEQGVLEANVLPTKPLARSHNAPSRDSSQFASTDELESLSTKWAIELASEVSTSTQTEDGAMLALGTTKGDVLVLSADGHEKWKSSCDGSITALIFHDHDLIVGTQTGKVIRLNDEGAVRWKYDCQFRPEQTIWPWWFLPTPLVGALAAGQDSNSGQEFVVAGTGSTNLNFLDAKTGELLADVVSPYGLPDRIRSHQSASSGELRFLTGHSRLTCGSSIRAWDQQAQEELRYEKSVTPMGRTMDGWDSCGLVDLWAGALSQDMPTKVVSLRHGAVNQITVYEEATGEPIWDATLGDAPVALEVVPGDSNSTARCYVAGQFGWLIAFDGTGKRVSATRVAPSLQGMQQGPDESLALWSSNELHIVRGEKRVQSYALTGNPLGLSGPAHAPGILCVDQSQLKVQTINWG